jgi:hypothetical protein
MLTSSAAGDFPVRSYDTRRGPSGAAAARRNCRVASCVPIANPVGSHMRSAVADRVPDWVLVSGKREAVIRGSHAVFAMLAVGKRFPRHTPTGEVTASTAVILRRPGVRSDGGGRRPAELPRLAPSPAVAPVVVLAILPAWTAEPPTCCRQVMLARRKVCVPTHSKSRSFKNGLPLMSDSVFTTPARASRARTAL